VILEGANEFTAYRVGEVTEGVHQADGRKARVTELRLRTPGRTTETTPRPESVLNAQDTLVYVLGAPLELAEAPLPALLPALEEPLAAARLTLDRVVLGLRPGQTLILSGERADVPGLPAREAVVLDRSEHQGGYTTLYLRTPLRFSYVLETAMLNANVARATHGETVEEVLGSGDGAEANQSFLLRRSPLTHVSAPTTRGAVSTLTVRVNGVAWQEESLYGLTPRSESYSVRMDDAGQSRVTFGDGQSGARLPSGSENVTATYRVGIGRDGEVDADHLVLMPSRPHGIRGVANPLPATGAAGPEALEEARVNAPRTVLTMERIVSLRDLETFVLAFPGVSKARAAMVWSGHQEEIRVTVATAAGEPIDPASSLYKNLVAAIESVRDPRQPVTVAGYRPVTFSLQAGIVTDRRYLAADVARAVEQALHEAFGTERRQFGQPVTAAEVMTLIQKVTGVVATLLAGVTSDRSPNDPLPALWPAPDELLTLNPVGAVVKESVP
jgi:predicted phage baseplate assembly protein